MRVISSWSDKRRKLVLAVDGHMGSGKSSLIELVAKTNSRILHISADDFIYPPDHQSENITKKANHPTSVEQYFIDFEAIRKIVHAYRHSFEPAYRVRLPDGDIKYFDFSKPIMIVEGLFLLHPRLFDNEWDKKIFITNEYNDLRATKEHILETAYRKYLEEYKPQTYADLVLK